MRYMTSEQSAKSHAIIHSASLSAGAVGAKSPVSDNLVITPIQLAMAISPGRAFSIDLSKSSAKAVMASAGGGVHQAGRVCRIVLCGPPTAL